MGLLDLILKKLVKAKICVSILFHKNGYIVNSKNKYIIERYSLGVQENLKSICVNNIEPRIEPFLKSKHKSFEVQLCLTCFPY